MSASNAPRQEQTTEPNLYTIPPLLRNLMLQRSCVAYVGAGFSMAAGMPGWRDLLAKLVEDFAPDAPEIDLIHARQALTLGDLPMAASIIESVMTGPRILNSLREVFGPTALHRATSTQQQQMKERLEKLMRGGWAGIVTTNYDELIEGTFVEKGAVWIPDIHLVGNAARFSEVLVRAQDFQTFFIKLHGSSSGPNAILTTEQYDETYLRTPQISIFLQALMLQYHLIFIGCSLEDEIVRIRRRLTSDFGASLPMAYALMPKNPQNEAKGIFLIKAARIQSIWYPSAPDDKEHKGLDDLLGQFASIGLSEDIRNLLRFKNLNDRFARVSPTNKRLLGYIARQKTRSTDLRSLIDKLLFDETFRKEIGLGDGLEEELKYRLMFLNSVGLLLESKADKKPIFTIPPRLTNQDLRKRGINLPPEDEQKPPEP